MSQEINTIAVLTSGGDSPGMNAAIRAVVRTALGRRWKVFGINKGYAGLLNNDFIEMSASSVGNIIQHGGTILGTSRCPEFHDKHHRERAVQILKDHGVDALIVIGGDGSFNGALALNTEHNFPVVGIPGTIDNDISGTEYTIGFDTAVQTAIEAVDKIRDTADANERTFLIEVMGRKSSAIALKVGVCTGAENVLLPQDKVDYDKIAEDIRKGVRRGKKSSIIIVAEGDVAGRSYKIGEVLNDMYKLQSRVCILGHIQRGGSPTSNDRFYASEMGAMAVEALATGNHSHVAVIKDGRGALAPLKDCVTKQDDLFRPYTKLARLLSI
jgi:6-phosphofructokinase 1